MPEQVIIHIGLHKTGSTAIQEWCFENRNFLAANNIFYPGDKSQKDGGHHPIAWGTTPTQRAQYLQFPLKTAIENATISGCKKMLISSEEFEFLPEVAIRNIKNTLGNRNVKIIVYLRNIIDFLIAEFQQHVKMAQTQFPNSIENFFIRHNFYGRLNYFALLEKWAKVFGHENIKISQFEVAKSALIPDFAKRVGIDTKIDTGGKIVNMSLGPISTELLRIYNQQEMPADARGNYIEQLIKNESTVDKEYTILDPDLAAQIIKNMEGPLSRLKNSFDCDNEMLRLNTAKGKKALTQKTIAMRRSQMAAELV